MTLEPRDERDSYKQAFDYAWAYFAVHATQRMQAVNFFLIAAAFLATAYVTAMVHGLFPVAAGISTLGSIVAYLFYRIERRIRSLIHAAEEPLKAFERRLADVTATPAMQILEGVNDSKPGEWAYSRVFRYLYGASGSAFFVGATYAVFSHMAKEQEPAHGYWMLIGGVLCVALIASAFELLALAAQTRSRQTDSIAQIVSSVAIAMSIVAFLVAVVSIIKLVFCIGL